MDIIFFILLLWLAYALIKLSLKCIVTVLVFAYVVIVYGGLCIYESIKNKEDISQLINRIKDVNKLPVKEYKQHRSQGIVPSEDFDEDK